jgi:hypothetical protein
MIKRLHNNLFEYLNTTRVDVATYVYDSYAKDEEKMKILWQDPWCLNKSWLESTPNYLALCFSL